MIQNPVRVQGVSKKFCRSLKRSLLYATADIARESLGLTRPPGLRRGEFYAVDDVSFEVGPGEIFGLIGRNGSGKTTLLKIIGGISRPDKGQINVCGRVAPLIALGAGFSPVLSGRENIYINMAILGLTPAEIRKEFDNIVDFSELAHAIDAPVQTYSSGMQARLGFACAIHTRPDIMLVDEILAVGDIGFRKKCYQRIAQLKKDGAAILVVQHNILAMAGLCDRALFMEEGKPILLGPAEIVAQKMETVDASSDGAFHRHEWTQGVTTTEPKITRVSWELPEGQTTLRTGRSATLRIEVANVAQHRESGYASFLIRKSSIEDPIMITGTSREQRARPALRDGRLVYFLQMDPLCLPPGNYSMKASFYNDGFMLDGVEGCAFRIVADAPLNGTFLQPHRWLSENGNEKTI